MGLLDILNSIQNSASGQRQPASSGSGAMSPIAIALMGLLAYKALEGRAGQDQPAAFPSGDPGGALGDILGGLLGGTQRGAPVGTGPGGNLSDQWPGGLGALLGGGQAGGVLSAGLGNLIKGFQDSGQGQTAQSWVGTGPNQEIAPDDLAQALGSDTLDALSRQTGVGRTELLDALRQQLPDLVDKLTPEGRLPTENEAARLV